jgi:ADP-ribose pyrophosphatase YjhB (NUDIX family)
MFLSTATVALTLGWPLTAASFRLPIAGTAAVGFKTILFSRLWCSSSSLPTKQMPSRFTLPYREGSHNSIEISIPREKKAEDTDVFAAATFLEKLTSTINECRERKKASIWVEVPMTRASLIEQMISTGLKFHHAHGELAKLVIWLPEDTACKIPEYATHHVGVGALVINSKKEILCVRELRKNYMPWKVPGGLSELGESIEEAALREVKEETGISCRFESIISFRHTHNIQFGRSDLYFMCRLEPIEDVDKNGNAVIPKPIAQVGEIEKVEWIPIQKYKEMICGENGHPMMCHIMRIFEDAGEIESTVISSIVPGRKPAPIYHSKLNDL